MKNISIKIGLSIIALLTKLLYATLTVKISEKSLKSLSNNNSAALFCWHGSIGMLPYVNSYFRKSPIVGLISKSRDGGYLAFFLSHFGISAERGSSGVSGGRAAINLIRILRSGGNICITPDGPRGPAKKIKSGMLTVIQKSPETRMLFIRINFGKSWQFNSWDNFKIPKPFSKIQIETFDFENVEALKKEAETAKTPYDIYCEELLG